MFAAILGAPGVLSVFAVDRLLHLRLDGGQLLVFGGVACMLEFGVIALAIRPESPIASYVLLCLVTVGVLAVAHWGFHARWPDEFFTALTRR